MEKRELRDSRLNIGDSRTEEGADHIFEIHGNKEGVFITEIIIRFVGFEINHSQAASSQK